MTPYVPSLRNIMETLRLAEQGYLIDDAPARPAVRPMPWRRILHHLIAMGRGDMLHVEPGASGAGGDDLVVRRIAANRRPVPARCGTPGNSRSFPRCLMPAAVSVNARLLALSRFAQSIESGVQRSRCRVICVKTNSDIRAYVTNPADDTFGAARAVQFHEPASDSLEQRTPARAPNPTHSLQTGGMST